MWFSCPQKYHCENHTVNIVSTKSTFNNLISTLFSPFNMVQSDFHKMFFTVQHWIILFQHYSMLNSVVFTSILKSCENHIIPTLFNVEQCGFHVNTQNHTVGHWKMLNSVVFTRLDMDVSPPTNCRVIKPYTSRKEGYSNLVKTTLFQLYSMLNSVVFTRLDMYVSPPTNCRVI